MELIKVKCSSCGKRFFRPIGRINEAKKFGWKPYCSIDCQSQARLKKRIVKVCANPNCNRRVSRELSQFKKSKSGNIFCSRSCAVSFNNSKFPKRKKIIIKAKCKYCGKEFIQEERAIYCSKKCKNKDQIINKEEILKQIRDFYKRHNRIPLKREFPHYSAARNRFGTWNKAVKAAGFETNPVRFAKKYIAKDGHICDSLAEKIIDDWLFGRKIIHERKIPYPKNKSLTVDFVTENKWIEFFGLAGEVRDYDKIIERKRKLCKKYKLPLIEIYPKDLFPVNRLPELIKIKNN